MAKSPRGNPAWKTGAGSGGNTGGAARRGGPAWKQTDTPTPGSGAKRFKQLALIGGIAVCLSLIVMLILYLINPVRPGLIIVGTNPAEEADRLDAPLDFYGWLGGKQFIADAKGRTSREGDGNRSLAPEVLTDPNGNPVELPADANGLDDWVNRFRGFDPVVIYMGVPTGTSLSQGAVLFTKGGQPVPVKEVLAAITRGLKEKTRKILILDPGRLSPDPVYGQLTLDFVAKLKDLNAEIAACPNLVVMCGTDVEQRGWESEELGTTAFAHHILRGLQGEASTNDSSISAEELFTFAKTKTEEWTRDNRPTSQTPILLPEGEDGLNRARKMDVAIKPTTASPAPPVAPPFSVPPALKEHWVTHDQLAAASANPASYTPRTWRRYRELLLRFEQAVRAGETDTITKLNQQLSIAESAIRQSCSLPPFQSTANSLAFAELVRDSNTPLPDVSNIGLGSDPKTPLPETSDGRLAYAARLLQLLAGEGGEAERAQFPTGLNPAVNLLKKFDPVTRPAEVHLPIMVWEFYSNVLSQAGPAPGDWARAVALRRRAEEAALGMGPVGALTRPDAGFIERIAPVIRPLIEAGDTNRRSMEDRLFSTDTVAIQQAGESGTTAKERYAQAVEIASHLRSAYALHDRLLADLACLNHWASSDTEHVEKYSDKLVSLWKSLHDFSRELDAVATNPPPATASAEDFRTHVARSQALAEKRAGELSREADAILTAFRAEIASHQDDAALQREWLPKQVLLNTPLIPAEQRMQVLRASRTTSEKLRTEGRKQAGLTIDGSALKQDSHREAVALGRLTLASLGSEILNANASAPDAQLHKAEVIEGKLLDLRNRADKWPDLAAEVAAALADHLKQLAKPNPPLTNDVNLSAERASRVAIAYTRDEGWEPAAANRRLRWRNLLVFLAERSADDHWFDETYDPNSVANPDTAPGKYYQVAANRYLGDANIAVAGLPGVSPNSITPGLEAKLNAKLLQAAKMPPILWTSDQKKSVRFSWSLPAQYPIHGYAIGLRRFRDLKPLTVSDAASNQTRPVMPLEPDALQIAAELTMTGQESVDAEAFATGVLYFRGQHPEQKLEIDIQRRPELVISDPLPSFEESKAAFAIKAQRDLDPGQVVVLLDLSGSMTKDLKGNEAKDGNSRFNQMLEALPLLLQDLPKGTPLRVRVFADSLNKTGSRIVYGTGGADDKPVVTWQRGNLGAMNALVDSIRRLTPYGFTPLAKSILDCARNDFDEQSAAKTLVVLTDGADEEPGEDKKPLAERLSRVRGLRSNLSETFRRDDVQLFVVRFALGGDDVQLSNELFRDLDTYKVPGQTYTANNLVELRTALLDAIRPKLKLETDGRSTPIDYPRVGWPSRMADDFGDNRYDLYWSPAVAANTQYRASAGFAPTRSDYPLYVQDGDRMLLGFAKDGKKIRIRRELYADYFRTLPDMVKIREDGRWALTNPASYVRDFQVPSPVLRSLLFLEKVPPHLLPPGLDVPPEDDLSQLRPGLLWWKVAPVTTNDAMELVEQPHADTITIRKRYCYPAPAWEVYSEHWPRNTKGAGYLPTRIQVWPLDGNPTKAGFDCGLDDTLTVNAGDGDPLEISVACEDHPIGSDHRVQSCLVVRVKHPEGKPVMVKYLNATTTNAEHRYYKKANSSTAVFGPFSRESLRAVRLRFEVVSLAPLIANEKASITIVGRPPKATPDQEFDYQPRLVKSMK